MFNFDDIVGNSNEILKVIALGKKVCNSTSPILVYGETGTGKELIVQAIHSASKRNKEPFIAQNCAAIPENMVESIFFGVAKGGYTGAVNLKGLFETAREGTLYLDELNSMSLDFQGKLLRVIEAGEYRRIGDSEVKRNKARIIASVNENPEFLIKSNRLRKDLYYRLNVVRIDIPTLNNRREDIPSLVDYFIKKHNKALGMKVNGIEEEALKLLIKKEYDGNIRELEHIIEGAINYKGEGLITPQELDLKDTFEDLSLPERIELMEKKYIKEALIIANYNISEASKILKIPRQTLQYKMGKYQLRFSQVGSSQCAKHNKG